MVDAGSDGENSGVARKKSWIQPKLIALYRDMTGAPDVLAYCKIEGSVGPCTGIVGCHGHTSANPPTYCQVVNPITGCDDLVECRYPPPGLNCNAPIPPEKICECYHYLCCARISTS